MIEEFCYLPVDRQQLQQRRRQRRRRRPKRRHRTRTDNKIF